MSSTKQFDEVSSESRVLEVVRGLLSELGHESAARSASVESHLDRDLGLGSLERVELLLRLEKMFAVRLDEDALAEAETVQSLIAAVGAATEVSAVLADAPAETLAARMGFLPQWLDQFLILNGLERDAALVPGQRYKVVTR